MATGRVAVTLIANARRPAARCSMRERFSSRSNALRGCPDAEHWDERQTSAGAPAGQFASMRRLGL